MMLALYVNQIATDLFLTIHGSSLLWSTYAVCKFDVTNQDKMLTGSSGLGTLRVLYDSYWSPPSS